MLHNTSFVNAFASTAYNFQGVSQYTQKDVERCSQVDFNLFWVRSKRVHMEQHYFASSSIGLSVVLLYMCYSAILLCELASISPL